MAISIYYWANWEAVAVPTTAIPTIVVPTTAVPTIAILRSPGEDMKKVVYKLFV